jgi:multicomponent Na+:H+ antiporter subunit D
MVPVEWLLASTIALPIVFGIGAVLVGMWRRVEVWFGLACFAAEAVLAMVLLSLLAGGEQPFLLLATTNVLGTEFRLFLAADVLGMVFLFLVALVGLTTALFALDREAPSPYWRYQPPVAMLVTATAAAVFLAGNFLSLYVFWQLAIICFGIAIAAGFRANALSAASKFLVVSEVGALLLLLAVGLVYTQGIDQAPMAWLALEDDGARLAVMASVIAAALALTAAAPLHTWFADAGQAMEHSLAPFLYGVQNKLGLFLLVRLTAEGLAGGQVSGWIPAILLFAVLSILMGSINALARRDQRRLLALLVVAQSGFVLLGLATGERLGLSGSLYYLVVQSLAVPLLLIALALVGGGLRVYSAGRSAVPGGRVVIGTIGFVVAAASLVGLPPFGGAVAQTLIYQGLIAAAGGDASRLLLVVVGLAGSVFSAGALVKIGGRAFVGEEPIHLPVFAWPARAGEAATLILAGLCLLVGFFPSVVLVPFVLPISGLASAAGLGDLAFLVPAGQATGIIWSPTLTAVLIALPVIVWALIYPVRFAWRRYVNAIHGRGATAGSHAGRPRPWRCPLGAGAIAGRRPCLL